MKGDNEEGTELLKVEWEKEKYGVSWIPNTKEHRPPAPWREWLKKKKESTALVRTSREEGGDGGGTNVWQAAEVLAAEQEISELRTINAVSTPAYDLLLKRAETALYNAACKALNPLAFKPRKFTHTTRSFSLGAAEAAALQLKQMPARTKEKGRAAWCWRFEDRIEAAYFFSAHGPLGATWTADAIKIFTQPEITKETPLRCAHVYCCSCHTCYTCCTCTCYTCI